MIDVKLANIHGCWTFIPVWRIQPSPVFPAAQTNHPAHYSEPPLHNMAEMSHPSLMQDIPFAQGKRRGPRIVERR